MPSFLLSPQKKKINLMQGRESPLTGTFVLHRHELSISDNNLPELGTPLDNFSTVTELHMHWLGLLGPKPWWGTPDTGLNSHQTATGRAGWLADKAVLRPWSLGFNPMVMRSSHLRQTLHTGRVGVWNEFLLLTLILEQNTLETMRNTLLKGQKISMRCSGFLCGLEMFHSPQAQGHHSDKREHIVGEISPSSGSYLWLIFTKLIQKVCFCISEAPSAQPTKC